MASELPFGSFEDRTVYVADVATVEDDAQAPVFACVVSTSRAQVARRDPGVDHVIVFLDELNEYAPHDGADTDVHRMFLDIAECGRFLGLGLSGAVPLCSAVKARLATLDNGQLMLRHPLFTPPIVIRVAWPSVMTGRDGVERFPPAPEPTVAQVADTVSATRRAIRPCSPDEYGG
jgi:hypothetical protein